MKMKRHSYRIIIPMLCLVLSMLCLAAAASAKQMSYAAWYASDRYINFTRIMEEATKAKLPDIQLEFMPHGGLDRQLTMLAAGSFPDVVAVHSTSSFPQLLEAGALKPLRVVDEDILNSVPRDLLEPFIHEGVLYAIPATVEVSNMGINVSMLSAAGLNYPDWNWTWNDLLNMSKPLTKDTNGDGRPDVWGTGIWWQGEQFVGPFVYANGGSFMNKQFMGTEVTINSPGTIQAYDYLRSLVHDYRVAFPGQGWNEWQAGIIAMNYLGSWSIGSAQRSVKDSFEWDYHPFPICPNTGKRGGRLSLIGVAVSATTTHDEALIIAQLAADRWVQEQFLITALSAVPARRDLFNSPYFLPPEVVPRNARKTMMDNLTGGYMMVDTVYPHPDAALKVREYSRQIIQDGIGAGVVLAKAYEELTAMMFGK